MDPSPVMPSDKTAALIDTLIANLWETLTQRMQINCAQTPNPQTLWDTKYVLF